MAYNEPAEHKARTLLKSGARDDALTVLMKAYGREIFRFCVSMLGNETDAQDVVQTAFIEAYQGFDAFAGGSTIRTWLFSIARHRCLDHIKKNKRLHARVRFVDNPPDMQSAGEDDPADTDPRIARVLRDCLSALSDGVRTAVLLRFQAGCSYAELAELAQEKAGTLQARVARALPVLRRCVEEHGVTL